MVLISGLHCTSKVSGEFGREKDRNRAIFATKFFDLFWQIVVETRQNEKNRPNYN